MALEKRAFGLDTRWRVGGYVEAVGRLVIMSVCRSLLVNSILNFY